MTEAAPKLSQTQENVYRSLCDHGYYETGKCGWYWDSVSNTERIMRVLERKGYARRQGSRFFPVPLDQVKPMEEIKLPSPYKPVKTLLVHVCDEEFLWRKDEVTLWIDPRDTISFCIVVPDFIGIALKGHEGLETCHVTGQYLFRTEAPKFADSHYNRLFAKYEELVKERPRREVIAVRLRWEPARLGAHRVEQKLDFTFGRYWLVDEREYFIQPTPDAALERTRDYPASAILLPYSPELYARLLEIRDGLASLGSALTTLLAQEGLAERLLAGAGLPQLTAPEADHD